MLDATKAPDGPDATADDDAQDQYDRDARLDHKSSKKDFDTLTLVSTALVMLVAGYDTTAQTLSFCAYELARHEEIQRRLQVSDSVIWGQSRNIKDSQKRAGV